MPDFAGFERPPSEPQERAARVRPGLEPIPILDAAEGVKVEIEVLKESHDEILRVISENEWDLEEGLRTLLLTGLGYQSARLRLGGPDSDANPDSERLNRLANDLAAYHSMYAVMKYKAFKLYKVNQVLDFNNSGLRAAERMWEGWAEVMRRQQADLQAEVDRLRARLSEFDVSPLPEEPPAGAVNAAPQPAPDVPETPPDSAPYSAPSLFDRLRRFFNHR